MNILSILKKKYQKEIDQLDEDKRRRRQLNMTVDERIIDKTKNLAVQFTVPRYCLVEHLLEIGDYYLTRAMENEDKAKMLRQHLINVHLIDNGIDDSEAILRIGEGSNISKLLFQVRPVLRSLKNLQHAVVVFKKTGNIPYLEKCRKELLRSSVEFALWIEEHHLDEPDNGDLDGRQL